MGVGELKPGDRLRARFAQFFDFKDGLIWRQRNYELARPLVIKPSRRRQGPGLQRGRAASGRAPGLRVRP